MATLTKDEVRAIVESEGLGEALTAYLDWKEIEPGPVQDAWRQALEAIGKVCRELELGDA